MEGALAAACAREVSLRKSVFGFALAAALLAAVGSAWAMPLHPRVLARARRDPALERALERSLAIQKATGVNAPSMRTMTVKKGPGVYEVTRVPVGRVSGAQKILVLLADFSDRPHQVAGTSFDSLVFADVTGPSSVRGYYREVSYGSVDITTSHPPSTNGPSAAQGWLRMPRTYAYYLGSVYPYTGTESAYPNNAQKMIEDAVDASDPYVDYDVYDLDANGTMDVPLVVIHAGTGYEYGGQPYNMWSHAWQTRYPPTPDGVRVVDYSTDPEYWVGPGDMTVGVLCHELGHNFGLPDLYDYDINPSTGNYESFGVGDWSLMASGSWNGAGGNGGSPARLDAWSATRLGFNAPVNVTTTITAASIPSVNATRSGSVYRVEPGGGTSGKQYFLVENRRKTGTDSYLPGQGLLVWHVDENKWGPYPNDDQTHYMVDLEEAHGGTQHLATAANQGDANDPFPTTLSTKRRTFNAASDPWAQTYERDRYVSVSGISDSAPTMSADLGPGGAASTGSDDQAPGMAIPASPIRGTLDSGDDDADVFRVSLTKGHTFSAVLTGPSGADFDLYLFPPGTTDIYSQKEVARSIRDRGFYPETITYKVAANGYYYVVAHAFGQDEPSSGSYTLRWSKSYKFHPTLGTSRMSSVGWVPATSAPRGQNVRFGTAVWPSWASKGRRVFLQRYVGSGRWVNVTSKRLSSSGVAYMYYRPGGSGRYAFRTVIYTQAGYKQGISPTRYVRWY